MVMTYRLTPINLDHESWKRSKVKQTVRVLARDCADARWLAAGVTPLTCQEPTFTGGPLPKGRSRPSAAVRGHR
jgi:hypothetical protein